MPFPVHVCSVNVITTKTLLHLFVVVMVEEEFSVTPPPPRRRRHRRRRRLTPHPTEPNRTLRIFLRFQRDKHPPRVRALGELRSGQVG